MGRRALEVKRVTRRRIREGLLSEEERVGLQQRAAYEGSPFHKRSPGDFGLTPPAAPRPDKTLCDEAGVTTRSAADALFTRAIGAGLVSEATAGDGFPKQLWVVEDGRQPRAFEAIYGGSRAGRYHGYPIRRSDPFFEVLLSEWRKRRCDSSSS